MASNRSRGRGPSPSVDRARVFYDGDPGVETGRQVVALRAGCEQEPHAAAKCRLSRANGPSLGVLPKLWIRGGTRGMVEAGGVTASSARVGLRARQLTEPWLR